MTTLGTRSKTKTTMAEGEKDQAQGWGGSKWLSGWINAAKEQTEKVFETVSTDLAEFTSTMQQDTKNAVEKTKQTMQQQTDDTENQSTSDMMKKSFHSFMSGITKALTVEPDEDTPVKRKTPADTTGLFDRTKARLRAVQVDTGTYLNDPTGPPEKYADWLKSFDLDNHKGTISDLLVTMVEVRSLYTSLVPSEVSHQDFWRRYFYKLHQLEVDEARKQALMKRADRANTKEDSVGWDEEEWSGDESSEPSPSKQTNSTAEKEEVKQKELKSRLSPEPVQQVTETKSESNDKHETKVNSASHSDNKVPVNVKQKKEKTSENNTENITDESNKNTENIVIKTNDSKTESMNTVSDDVMELKDSKKAPDEVVSEKIESPKSLADEVVSEKSQTSESSNDEVVSEKSQAPVTTGQSKPQENIVQKVCDKTEAEQPIIKASANDKTEVKGTENVERDLKTKVKGDMVVVGDRESPSSESSGNKESITEDWEQDFDVEITPEDLAAASDLAQKMNMSATDYNTITGEDDDWENWD